MTRNHRVVIENAMADQGRKWLFDPISIFIRNQIALEVCVEELFNCHVNTVLLLCD